MIELLTARPILTLIGIFLILAIQVIFYAVFDDYANNGGEDDDEIYSDD